MPVKPLVAVFLRAPQLGAVKTRLAAEVGERDALHLYRVMAAGTLAAVERVAFDATIWFTPSEAAAEMRGWLGDRWDLRTQVFGDFGARLAFAAEAVAPGRTWMAIGGDCPGLGADLLREAADIITGGAVALGPTVDGGYYLIGGVTPLPDIFTGIPWGTARVLPETRSRLGRAAATVCELPVLRDVDTAADAVTAGLLPRF